jgi:hypothetical protein
MRTAPFYVAPQFPARRRPLALPSHLR